MPSVPSVTPRPAGRARGAGAVLRGFVPRSGRESHDGEGTATPAGREWREARPRDPVLDAPRRLKATAARTSRRLRPALGPGAWRTRSRLETVLPPSQRPDATRAPFANVLRGDRSPPSSSTWFAVSLLRRTETARPQRWTWPRPRSQHRGNPRFRSTRRRGGASGNHAMGRVRGNEEASHSPFCPVRGESPAWKAAPPPPAPAPALPTGCWPRPTPHLRVSHLTTSRALSGGAPGPTLCHFRMSYTSIFLYKLI